MQTLESRFVAPDPKNLDLALLVQYPGYRRRLLVYIQSNVYCCTIHLGLPPQGSLQSNVGAL